MSGALDDLRDRFRESLVAKNRTSKHASLVDGRIRDAFRACGFNRWTELDALRLERHLSERRTLGTSTKTSNDILASAKQFTKWAVEHGLTTSDPLAILHPVRNHAKRERRALTWSDELPRLIRAAASGPEHRGMSGSLRALVYRLAAETGLRVAEIQSLRTGDFDTDKSHPTLTVRAEVAKNRRIAVVPLRAGIALELAPYLRSKHPASLALPLPVSFKDKATRWLKFDLEAAEIPYKDESGRFADFHALRVTFISALIAQQTHPKAVQALARHASPDMTLGVYTKIGRDDEAEAISRLTELPSCQPDTGIESVAAQRTGTHGDENRVASSVAFPGGSHDTPMDSGRSTPALSNARRTKSKRAARKVVEAAGIEPASWSRRTTNVYVCIPWFGSRREDAHGQASF